VRLCDVGDQNVSGPGRQRGAVFSEKLPYSFDNSDAQLAFNVMGVDGKFLSGPEIEVDDFEVRGFVDEEPFDRFVFKPARFVKTDSPHERLLSCGYISFI
jgi:hypothetical protein